MMYVVFMKNFFLAGSNELLAVRLEMSLTATRSFESARKKFFIKIEGEKKIFHKLDVHHV